METEKGKIVGVGIGPGAPDMLTLRAVGAVREADVICLPQSPKEKCRAYLTAVQAVPEIADKRCVCFDFRMTRDPDELARIHDEIYRGLRGLYAQGLRIAFLTIGDPAVYSTFTYMAERARRDGLRVEIVPGVTSFCAAAASLQTALCEGDGQLHVASGRDDLEKLMEYPGTKVIMKCGRDIKKVKALLLGLEERGRVRVFAVSECGSPGERRYCGAAAIPETEGYMTTVIVQEAT